MMSATQSWSICLQILEERLRYADTTSFTTAMQVLAVAGQWQRCLVIVEQMEACRIPVDLLACMALVHAAREAPALHHWAAWLAMQEAFTQALACEQNLRKRLEAMVQLAKLDYCVCISQGEGSTKGRLRHPHLEELLRLPDIAARHLIEVNRSSSHRHRATPSAEKGKNENVSNLPAGIEKAKPTKPPTFACWRVANADTDVSDVLLHWHPDLPQQLPSNQEEAICTLQLCQRDSGGALELLEARLQQHHLVQPLSWTESQLQRLMDVMAHQRLGNPPHEDEVRLRRAPGRMVIDVHFRSGKASELSGCVVEILNAYASGMSQSVEVLRLLRSAACAQRVHQSGLEETNENLQALRKDLGRLEGEWTAAMEQAKKQHRGLLQRFALVLQAKIDKELVFGFAFVTHQERSLHNEVQEKRWAQMGAANVAQLAEVRREDAPEDGALPRGRGGRGGRGR
eukprot:symbB.v1.2.039840.t1/scaffold6777.1/size15618/1